MERRKNEIHANFNRLKEECGSLVELLNSLLDQHMKSMKVIDDMTPEEILKNPNFFINQSKKQYEAIQKVLTLNLDLESFISSETTLSHQISSKETFQSQLSLNIESDESSSNKTIINRKESINLMKTEESKSTNTIENETLDVIKTQAHESTAAVRIDFSSERENSNSFVPKLNSTSVTEKDIQEKVRVERENSDSFVPKVNAQEDIEEKVCVEIDNSRPIVPKLDVINYGIVESSESSDFPEEPTEQRYPPSLKMQKSDVSRTNSSEKLVSVRRNTPDSAKHGSRSRKCSAAISDSSESSETMTDKLSKRTLVSRQQRYLNNLKKPPMPDLSFQVVPRHSSTEFCSATESENDVQTDTDTTYKESYDYNVIKNTLHLKLNDKCIISHVISPSEFYVSKLVENHDQFEEMIKGLEKLGNYFKKFTSKKEAKTNIDKFCMAYSVHWESWNRAEVLDWKTNAIPETDGVKVQFVDYGDYEIVPYNNLRILPHDLCDKPRLAIKCHLAYLFAPNSTPLNLSLKWPESSINAVKEYLEINSQIYNVIYLENYGYSNAIDLEKYGTTEEGNTIGELLMKSKNAVEITEDNHIIRNSFMKQQLITAQGMVGIAAHMNENEVMHQFCENVEITESNKLEEAFTGYAAQDEARRCKYAKNGTCFKGANCKLDHEPLNPDGTTTDKMYTYIDALNSLPSPEVGQSLTILITSVCTVQSFYGHVMSYNADGDSLRNLMSALNAKNVQHPPMKILPAIGEIVIAKYCDEKWYRARACDVMTNNEVSDLMVKVFFVDFGDVLDVKLKDLRQISERYLHLPFQAVRFHINNIIPKRDSDKSKAVEHFEQVYLYKKFTAEVIRVPSSFIEVLLTNAVNEDIGTQLIDSGYAEPKILSLLPLENGKFLVD